LSIPHSPARLSSRRDPHIFAQPRARRGFPTRAAPGSRRVLFPVFEPIRALFSRAQKNFFEEFKGEHIRMTETELFSWMDKYFQ